MASSCLPRPVGTSHLFHTSPFGNRRVCRICLQRGTTEAVLPIFFLQCGRDRRLRTSLSINLLASSARFNGPVPPRGYLIQTIELDANVSVPHQLVKTESPPIGSSTMSNGSAAPSIMLAPAGTAPLTTPSILVEDSQPFTSQGRHLEGEGENRPFFFQKEGMENCESTVSSSVIIYPQGNSSEQTNGSGSPLFSQMQPVGQATSMTGSQLSEEMYGSGRPYPMSYDFSTVGSQRQHHSSPQTDIIAQINSMEVPPSSEYYEPNNGDLVLGVVTHANDTELSIEIGGRVPALMTTRDFQPLTEVGTNSFFKLPLDNDNNETVEGFVVPPVGKVLLVDDRPVDDGAHPGETVKIGTIFVAEVLRKVFGEGRPLLTCRRLAEKLAFLRIEQIMRTGEPIQIEITAYNDGGVQGCFEGMRAFLPKSELLVRPESTAAMQDYVGKTLTVAVVKVEHYVSNVIISEIKPWMSKNLLLGTVHDLLVTKLFPYGLQVEILDTRVRGFIHITSVTRGFVTSVYTFFTEGEVIKGMVIKGRKPGQLSFSIEALEPPDEEGLFLRNKERVYDGAEDVAKSSPEYQLPMEERRLFAKPSAATSVTFQDRIANLPWLHLQKWRNTS